MMNGAVMLLLMLQQSHIFLKGDSRNGLGYCTRLMTATKFEKLSSFNMRTITEEDCLTFKALLSRGNFPLCVSNCSDLAA